MNPIELHIEELVLHGFNPADRLRIGDAVERELARLLATSGIAAVHRENPRIDAGEFRSPAGASAETIGALMATNLHGALSRER